MKILIVSNPWFGNRARPEYLINILCEIWKENGYDVEYVFDTKSTVAADIAFLHVDLTEVSARYSQFVRYYPVVINGRADSIAKDLYSEHLLTRDDSYAGKVIVKTKQNSGGMPELKSQGGIHQGMDRVKRKLIPLSAKGGALSNALWANIRSLDPTAYPIFNGIEDVPGGVWENENLIVQKFLPERDSEGRHLLRHWYFFGEKESQETLVSRNPIVKRPDSEESRAHLQRQMRTLQIQRAKVPQKLREVRHALGLDYGRLDWVMFEGEPVIFDVNKTPVVDSLTAADDEVNRARGELVRQYAMGIEDFLEK